MAHLHFVNERPDSTPIDERGDLVDLIVFCSDSCHYDYVHKDSSLIYEGWNGCHEVSATEPCAECGVPVQGLDED